MSDELPTGFRFAGVHCGIKRNPNKNDLSLFVSDRPASAAGVFTQNRVYAAPVAVSRERVPAAEVRAVVVNSGNANACTGPDGRAAAEQMTQSVAGRIGCEARQVLVCSTGVIGRPMPMTKVLAGIDEAAGRLSPTREGWLAAAAGILTTDTVTKVSSRSLTLGGSSVAIAGVAKGAAMIAPNMATMLAVILTDAAAPPRLLDAILRRAVDASFNAISVEGHMSTNDSVIVLANGGSGVAIEEGQSAPFEQAISEVAMELARAIIYDAEGATHFIEVLVRGASSDADARRIARTVVDSPLVKTAIHGNDPNWGRICSAAGYAGVPFDERNLSLRVNGTLLYQNGVPAPFDSAAESARMKASREVAVELIFDLGTGAARMWTCDLSEEYIRLNADYTT